MSRLIESIKLYDGKFYNLSFHEQRMKHSLGILFGKSDDVDLNAFLLEHNFPARGLYKCRIVYDDKSRETTFSAYEPRIIRRVRMVEDDQIFYEHKFEDRSAINRLFALRGDCDDVVIVRNGKVTDCSFSNIIFRNGKEWYTPEAPLLNGTMRQNLIVKNKVKPREIRKTDVRSFDAFKIINAMLEFDSPEIEVSEIVF